jgi:hypothetical protein
MVLDLPSSPSEKSKQPQFVGDHDEVSLTEQEYRTAKANLCKWGFATFKPTNKGTVATLANARVFGFAPLKDNEQTNGESTDSQRKGNEQPTDAQRTGND